MRSDQGTELTVPRYGHSALADLTPALLASLGVAGAPNALDLPPTERVCLLLIDGLGQELLARHPGKAPYLTSLLTAGAGRSARVLSAGFPSTTSVSMASVGTGLPPGQHGMVGYTTLVPDSGELFNALRWDQPVDPLHWQPHPTVYQRAAEAGLHTASVGRTRFADSGLTQATQRGAAYLGSDLVVGQVALAAEACRQAPALVFVYHDELDFTGHQHGCESRQWRDALVQADRLAERLAAALPSGTAFYVTADHGMVDVLWRDSIDVDDIPELRDGVVLIGGEPRARHVYTRPGAAAEVAAAWRQWLTGRALVLERERAIAEGWFGPVVTAAARARIGDVVAMARGRGAILARRTEPRASSMVGMHGSMTDAERLVPLLRAEQ